MGVENSFGPSNEKLSDASKQLWTTWVHYYVPESKQDSMQWYKKGTPPPNKFKVSKSSGKMMATIFWNLEGILLIDYKEKCQYNTQILR